MPPAATPAIACRPHRGLAVPLRPHAVPDTTLATVKQPLFPTAIRSNCPSSPSVRPLPGAGGGGGGGAARASFEQGGGRGFWTQKLVYQKWPDQRRGGGEWANRLAVVGGAAPVSGPTDWRSWATRRR